jgi:hypothetical protein
MQRVARANRVWPAQLVDPGRAHPAGLEKAKLQECAETQRQALNAAGDQPAERRLGGSLGIGMKGLRVEGSGEIDDHAFADGYVGADETIARPEIFEIHLGHARLSYAGEAPGRPGEVAIELLDPSADRGGVGSRGGVAAPLPAGSSPSSRRHPLPSAVTRRTLAVTRRGRVSRISRKYFVKRIEQAEHPRSPARDGGLPWQHILRIADTRLQENGEDNVICILRTVTADERLFCKQLFQRHASGVEFLSPAFAFAPGLLDRHAQLGLARSHKVIAIFRAKTMDEIREYYLAQGWVKSGISPSIDESRHGTACGSAKQRESIGKSVFKIGRNIPGVVHHSFIIDQNRDEPLSAQFLDHCDIGEPRRSVFYVQLLVRECIADAPREGTGPASFVTNALVHYQLHGPPARDGLRPPPPGLTGKSVPTEQLFLTRVVQLLLNANVRFAQAERRKSADRDGKTATAHGGVSMC